MRDFRRQVKSPKKIKKKNSRVKGKSPTGGGGRRRSSAAVGKAKKKRRKSTAEEEEDDDEEEEDDEPESEEEGDYAYVYYSKGKKCFRTRADVEEDEVEDDFDTLQQRARMTQYRKEEVTPAPGEAEIIEKLSKKMVRCVARPQLCKPGSSPFPSRK